jgi:hypothetical protein
MPREPLFAGLVIDENDQPVGTALVGDEPCYVVNDAGFYRHISSDVVDRQVIQHMIQLIEGHEDVLAEQAAKMLGQEDIFSKALLMNQFKNIDQQLEQVLKVGIPENMRAYLGMMGFRVRINLHGDVLDVDQPGMIDPEGEGE